MAFVRWWKVKSNIRRRRRRRMAPPAVEVKEECIVSRIDNRPISTIVTIIAMQTEALPLVDTFRLTEDLTSVGSLADIVDGEKPTAEVDLRNLAAVSAALGQGVTKVVDYINGKSLSEL